MNNSSVKVVLAPHELKSGNIQRLMRLGNKAVYYTNHTDDELEQAQVLIVWGIYRYADVAYIGGGFGVGIHNMLEASMFRFCLVLVSRNLMKLLNYSSVG
ncbi:MAG: hypothetical protein ACK5MI_06115 [Mangrovibacterium sp.]